MEKISFMKTGTIAFVLSLVLFATGTTTVALTLAATPSTRTPRRAPVRVTIPWYCVKSAPSSGSYKIQDQLGDNGKPVGPTISFKTNQGYEIQERPTIVVEQKMPKATPPFPKLGTETQNSESGDRNPGYNPGTETRRQPSKSGQGDTSMIAKNGGSSNGTPGYYNSTNPNDPNSNNTFNTGGTSNSNDAPGIYSWNGYELEFNCPQGYEAIDYYQQCFQLLQKKVAGKLTIHDTQSKLYAICPNLIKPAAWNTKISAEMCTAYQNYVYQCEQSKGQSCPLEDFIKSTKIPAKELMKTIGDLNQFCWLFN